MTRWIVIPVLIGIIVLGPVLARPLANPDATPVFHPLTVESVRPLTADAIENAVQRRV